MTDYQRRRATRDTGEPTETSPARASANAKGKKKGLSMHEGIAVWCDCCSCEAEPYWAEMAEALGVDLGSDYEDEDVPGASET